MASVAHTHSVPRSSSLFTALLLHSDNSGLLQDHRVRASVRLWLEFVAGGLGQGLEKKKQKLIGKSDRIFLISGLIYLCGLARFVASDRSKVSNERIAGNGVKNQSMDFMALSVLAWFVFTSDSFTVKGYLHCHFRMCFSEAHVGGDESESAVMHRLIATNGQSTILLSICYMKRVYTR